MDGQSNHLGVLFLAWIFGLGLIFLVSERAAAQERTPYPSDDAVNAVAKQLYCPVCENVSLDVCPTRACAEWRELIRQKLAEGWDVEQIRVYFATQYGDRVLAEPPRRGINWLMYLFPPLFLLGGGVVVYRVLWRARSRHSEAEIHVPDETDQRYLTLVEEELKRRK